MRSGDGHLTRVKAALIGEPEIEWPPCQQYSTFSLYHYSTEPSILRYSTPSPSFSSLHHPPSPHLLLFPVPDLIATYRPSIQRPGSFSQSGPTLSSLFSSLQLNFHSRQLSFLFFFRLSPSSSSLLLLFLSLFLPLSSLSSPCPKSAWIRSLVDESICPLLST